MKKIDHVISLISSYILPVIIFCFTSAAYAGDTISLDNGKGIAFPQTSYEVLEDTSGKLTIEAVIKWHSNSFRPVDEFSLKDHQARDYWIRLTVQHPVAAQSWLLTVFSIETPEVLFLAPAPSGSFAVQQAGSGLGFYEKDGYKVRYFVFELPPVTSATATYYLKVKSFNIKTFFFRIHPAGQFVADSTREYYVSGIFYGILFLVAFYNFVLLLTSGEKIYLSYLAYVCSAILYAFTWDGLGFQFLWPDHPSFNVQIGWIIAPALFLISFILYSRRFLELPSQWKRLDRLVLLIVVLYLAVFLVPGLFSWNFQLPMWGYYIPFGAIYFVSLYTFIKGYKPARLYILAYSLLCASILITILRVYEIVPVNIVTLTCFNVSLLAEIVVMSFANAEKLRSIKEEKNLAQKKVIEELQKNKELQEKVNRELEAKVTERTELLNQANAELTRLSEELKAMNSKLDYDNWHLKRKISEEKQTSVVSKVVSFEEFRNIFPSEISCQKYIESVKWKDDHFQCRKCSNPKYLFLPKYLSRKCTKCDYIESVTANTLYHKVRFPLVKAFYITHVVVNDIKNIPLEELTATLELSKNTCWKFRKKVDEKLRQLEKSRKHVENWKDLIVD